MDRPTGCESIIEAFTIFGKYTVTHNPTHCEHDELTVVVRPRKVSPDEIARLHELGFFVCEDEDCFKSFRFGNGNY